MAIEKPRRRMTLQELLVQLEKHAHAFEDFMKVSVYPQLGDLREMSRPRRKHSQYPTAVAMQNALEGLRSLSEELEKTTDAMMEWFAQVDEHVQRAKR
jgi:hypothetical protein